MALLNMIVYYVCGAIWLYRGFNGYGYADLLVAFIFIAAGITWTFRYVKQKNKNKE